VLKAVFNDQKWHPNPEPQPTKLLFLEKGLGFEDLVTTN